jgi:hypothetical protein
MLNFGHMVFWSNAYQSCVDMLTKYLSRVLMTKQSKRDFELILAKCYYELGNPEMAFKLSVENLDSLQKRDISPEKCNVEQWAINWALPVYVLIGQFLPILATFYEFKITF